MNGQKKIRAGRQEILNRSRFHATTVERKVTSPENVRVRGRIPEGERMEIPETSTEMVQAAVQEVLRKLAPDMVFP